jgi:pSer/pThr/pTyr-binding forkhead associated (FHA) protein
MRACSESTREPRLVALTGILSGEVFPLAPPDVTFGRDAANTICCPDPALSRRHCIFRCGPDGWALQDLDSSNGTFVNGVQITTQGLTAGDRIATVRRSSTTTWRRRRPASRSTRRSI